MFSERRAVRRVVVDIPAKVDAGQGLPLRHCRVVDISEQGARLEIEDADEMPQEFTILLTPSGLPRRRCRLIWRSRPYVGVEFDHAIEERVWH